MPFKPGKSGNPATQFKKGQSGNPKGRKNAAKDILNKILDTEIEDRTKREQILNTLVNMASRGNLHAIREVLDRTEGKSTEHIITEDIAPIRILEFGDEVIDEKE
tara:strand:- start:215 stop:529 length:315 start_codon:yes stop_codon:yes gene_type:complete